MQDRLLMAETHTRAGCLWLRRPKRLGVVSIRWLRLALISSRSMNRFRANHFLQLRRKPRNVASHSRGTSLILLRRSKRLTPGRRAWSMFSFFLKRAQLLKLNLERHALNSRQHVRR